MPAHRWGLSYSKITYSQLQLGSRTIGACEAASLSVTLANVGAHDTDETVMVFAEWATAPNPTPDRQLVAFRRVGGLRRAAAGGKAVTVTLRIEARHPRIFLYKDLGVTPCGARLGIGKGGKGAVRLPRILVLTI